MKYETPQIEMIELIDRDVFMTVSPGVDNVVGDGTDKWGDGAP